MSRGRRRGNGEGSIYRTPGGLPRLRLGDQSGRHSPAQVRQGVDVRGDIGEVARSYAQARRGPVLSRTPRLSEFLEYWLAEVVRPDLAP